ncbi:MAG: GNAT family N-acetyltransferase [Alphaproteobacteria bacterium]|jgi:GNAT superfamily N-acetyltransferase|nr:GNAT family N-acetyltransferase [Alphaproteobacteria bacterium]
MIRKPRHEDIADLARIHVQAWRETYRGLIPEAEITRRDIGYRERLWAKLIDAPGLVTRYAPCVGFAQVGPQRDADFADRGYTGELYNLYVLAAHQGTGIGRQLLDAVRPDTAFTALMVSGNDRAGRFYIASGATFLDRREVTEDGMTFMEDAYGWPAP